MLWRGEVTCNYFGKDFRVVLHPLKAQKYNQLHFSIGRKTILF